ncbi:tripartite tricarboxylate transporter substrate binding protein [Oceanobacillus bengalensis]|uniref:Tripartite tricarboxylate transporter substrate binding protein n=1 Tax=Oceanobacillus bengalensis TaxID=1435466 RepID=A0A494YZ90_9BACI|nr:tripartite tricarboxylate transporter substrate-binding protein [Oceanobacillus bengalensis]RKQ15537.1 tripartite tricarboxylate transporter substrate binding protein [Oceanobacillus bengalensis]
MKKLMMILGIALVLFLAACGDESASSNGGAEGSDGDWVPEGNIELVAPSAAGGGWDTTSRMVAQVLNEEGITERNVGVINKEGGSGSVGWAYIAERNDPHNIFITNPQIVTSPLSGIAELGWEDFTPIANVIADYAAFVVHADAEWNDLNELMDDIKANPQDVSVVGNSVAGGLDHLQFLKIAKAAGVDPTTVKYVATQDGSAMTSLLNGNVDVYSTGLAEVIEQVRAGNIKVLAITSEERIEGDIVSEFPTAVEQGIDETFINWRGFMGPGDMDPAAVAYYEDKFKQVSDSEAFAEIREQFGWSEVYMDSEEFKAHIQSEHDAYRELLEDLGMLKQ